MMVVNVIKRKMCRKLNFYLVKVSIQPLLVYQASVVVLFVFERVVMLQPREIFLLARPHLVAASSGLLDVAVKNQDASKDNEPLPNESYKSSEGVVVWSVGINMHTCSY